MLLSVNGTKIIATAIIGIIASRLIFCAFFVIRYNIANLVLNKFPN